MTRYSRWIAGLGLALVAGTAWSFPVTPCAVATATCKTVVLSGLNPAAGAGNPLAAQAVFQISGSTLDVTLSNITGADVLLPSDVLTGLFFNLRDTASSVVGLTPVSATLDPGSAVVFGPQPAGGVVGGEWAYKAGLNVDGLTQGISSSGLGLFGNPNFNGPDLNAPVAVNGLNYGILSAGDNPTTGNAAVTGAEPLVKDTVRFQLNIGANSGFDLAKAGALNVAFQYGTDLKEPRLVPLPSTLALLGVGALGMLGMRRRRAAV